MSTATVTMEIPRKKAPPVPRHGIDTPSLLATIGVVAGQPALAVLGFEQFALARRLHGQVERLASLDRIEWEMPGSTAARAAIEAGGVVTQRLREGGLVCLVADRGMISAEAIASDVGLGYRIFLVRRYLAMDVILPYVAWISLLAIATDALLQLVSRKAFPWAHGEAK